VSLVFPCEIISWQVLPAVRREITSYLINEKKVSRKVVSKKLGLTEAAVCQYLKHKRGGLHKFTKHDLDKIKKMADLLLESDKALDGMCFVCKEFDAATQVMGASLKGKPAE